MHVIARPALRRAGRRHADARKWLDHWWRVARAERWESLEEVRNVYPPTDQVECCLIFDVRGNKYRLICRVTYANQWQRGTLLVKHFLTHAEYDQVDWQKDCAERTP